MATSAAAVARPPLLLSPKELHHILSQQKNSDQRSLRILDATWFMPNVKRDPRAEFNNGPRLPGALFWDVDCAATLKGDVDAEGSSLNPLGLSHMMPTPEKFARIAGQDFGIDRDTHVVVYDTHGVFSAPRTAFTFHAFGHPAVSILNGGLPAWLSAGMPVEKEGSKATASVNPLDYPTPTLITGLIRSYDEMVANARMGSRGQTVLDARPAGRFDGSAPEPRPGLSSGHIPSSLSLPATTLLDTQPGEGTTYTTLKSQTDLWRTVADSIGGMDALDKLRHSSSAGAAAATNTCGSGMTAAILWLGLHQLGIESSIYDESWTGYASRETSVIDKEE